MKRAILFLLFLSGFFVARAQTDSLLTGKWDLVSGKKKKELTGIYKRSLVFWKDSVRNGYRETWMYGDLNNSEWELSADNKKLVLRESHNNAIAANSNPQSPAFYRPLPKGKMEITYRQFKVIKLDKNEMILLEQRGLKKKRFCYKRI